MCQAFRKKLTCRVTGIISTGTIDPASNTVYVVRNAKEPQYTHRLYRLSLVDGSIVAMSAPLAHTTPTNITFNDIVQNQRVALTLNNGVVYVAFGAKAVGLAVNDNACRRSARVTNASSTFRNAGTHIIIQHILHDVVQRTAHGTECIIIQHILHDIVQWPAHGTECIK